MTIFARTIDNSVARLYKKKLIDLGDEGDKSLAGILSPRYEDALVNKYVQSQFLESAHEYLKRYQNTEHFTHLISTAFQRASIVPQNKMTILDIGSGAGNTIFPLLTLCPDSHVIASDLSIDMLVILKSGLDKFIRERGGICNCSLLQLNAEELDFVEGAFDLVIGGAVLHHMISPEKTLRECSIILKNGGHAIFFEPFEEGNVILRCAYNDILNDSRQNALREDLQDFFRALITDYDVRMVREKLSRQLHSLDDKWFFNRKFFFDIAAKYKFSDCRIHPLLSTERQFCDQTISNLRLGRGMGRDALPDWAWNIIREFDECFSEDTKKELLIEGCVILKK